MKKLLLFMFVLVSAQTIHAQTLLHYFKFNNSVTNEAGTASFLGGHISAYGIGMDTANVGKMVVTGDNLVCSLPNLPQGNAPRSFSIWARFPANITNQYLASYGTTAAAQAFGLTHGNTLTLYGWATDVVVPNSGAVASQWYHYVCIYDGTTMKIYLNGLLKGSLTTSLNTVGNNFYIGSAAGSSLNSINALVDELQIYSGALTEAQVNYLYTIGGPIQSQTAPTIANVNATPSSESATVYYSLNANGLNTTSFVRYGTSAAALTSQTSSEVSQGTNTAVNKNVLLTGLLPSTTYYYQIEAQNGSGTTTSAVESFTTTVPIVPQAIAEYNFNNTFENINGNAPFSTNTGTSFTTDRHGNALSALNIFNSGSTATIPNLPYGTNPRSVSFWVKINSWSNIGEYSMVYSYGQSANSSAQGVGLFPQQVGYFGYANSYTLNTTHTLGTWYHYVMTYDGTNAKIFKNGTLLSTQAKTWNTLNNNDLFKLGIGVGAEVSFHGAIDDLKIYNYAVTDSEVLNLYTYNSLASHAFQSQDLKVTMHPNPASNVVHIAMESELKSVEIYSLQGQKILTSTQKEINVAGLSPGIYLVRVEDANQAVVTQKLNINE